MTSAQLRKSKPTFTPAYRTIEADLRKQIQLGTWPVGSMLPGRRDLAKRYNVDHTTIERATSALLDEGILRAEGRRGTFVAKLLSEPPVDHASSIINRGAQTLRSEAIGSLSIGLISHVHADENTPSNNNDFTWDLLRGLERECSETQWFTSVATVASAGADTRDKIYEVANRFLDAKMDGVMVVGYYPSVLPGVALEAMAANGAAIILVSPNPCRLSLAQCYYDSRDAGRQAAAHLISQGCKTLLYLSPAPLQLIWVEERLTGIRDAMQVAGLPDEALTICASPTDLGHKCPETLAPYVASVLDQGNVPDGVIGSNDNAAIVFMDVAAERGLVAGQDYLVVGFDDTPTASSRGLTSMRLPATDMAREAVNMMTTKLRFNKSPTRVCVDCQIVRRMSSLARPSAIIYE